MKERFKQIMLEKNLTQQQMATMIGIDTSTVSCFCNGKRQPGFDVLVKIAQAFPDVDLNWLINGVGKNDNEDNNHQMSFDFNNTQRIVNECITNKPANTLPTNKRSVKRVILLFDDGTIESYGN